MWWYWYIFVRFICEGMWYWIILFFIREGFFTLFCHWDRLLDLWLRRLWRLAWDLWDWVWSSWGWKLGFLGGGSRKWDRSRSMLIFVLFFMWRRVDVVMVRWIGSRDLDVMQYTSGLEERLYRRCNFAEVMLYVLIESSHWFMTEMNKFVLY